MSAILEENMICAKRFFHHRGVYTRFLNRQEKDAISEMIGGHSLATGHEWRGNDLWIPRGFPVKDMPWAVFQAYCDGLQDAVEFGL